ncbi:hypothetical protein DFH11DRAFT_85641 [Phellopilus nigrolimitatus]|nr:hypothetical protein DFH11DRAFT_85641 [Phellopilus nigrolimitatus]
MKDNLLVESSAGPSTRHLTGAHNVSAPITPARQPAASKPSSPSPEPSRFRELADASSCSPDPAAMRISASPSPAELLANIFNARTNASPGRVANGRRLHQQSRSQVPQNGKGINFSPTSTRRALSIMSTGGPPSPKRLRAVEPHAPTPLTNIEQFGDLNRSTDTEDSDTSNVGNAVLNAHLLNRNDSTMVPSAGHSAHVRPFRSGSVRLEPSSSQSSVQVDSMPSQTQSHLQSQCQAQSLSSEHEPPFPLPQPTADIYVHADDMLNSSLEPSLPVFSQAFDGVQSQWALQTQAPYSFDSQLVFDSQSQSQ